MSLTDMAERRNLENDLFSEGYEAYLDGAMYEQNPYVSSSLEYQQWAEGYCTAEMSHLDYDDVNRE